MKLLLILGLVINLTGYGEIPEEGMRIEMTEAHEDMMTGEMVMELTGTVLCDTELSVSIERSEAGITDEFCCAGKCTTGNGQTTEQLTFTPNGMAEWFSHYNPAPTSDVTISYTFTAGAESRTLTVRYLYGVSPTTLFPRKHLIEEFTGQACGYCPYGMDCISEFMKNDTNFILILHHYGYQADNFSVAESKTITNSLGVNGAPSVAIDRAKTKTSETNTIVFHPAYLPEETDKAQFATETYASVNIANTYDPKKHKLTVTVSGEIRKEDHPALNLTVLVKESGMLDSQADYYGSFEGWKEFRHCNAVRLFLTAAKGDALTIDSTTHRYSATYTTTLKDTWVPENCMVVAFLGESFKPIIQVEDEPVVAGTAGGADIEHGGVTPVPVADYYPEPNATKGPGDYSGAEMEELEIANAYRTAYPEEGYNEWSIQAYSTSRTITVSGVKCVPFLWMYFFTAIDEKTLPNGTFTFDTSHQPGTAYAGFRDDEHQQIDGSIFYFTSKSYFNQGYLVPSAEWLITEGSFVMSDTGWSIRGKARNGSDIRIVGTTAIEYEGKPQDIDLVNTDDARIAHKHIEDGRLVIRTADGQVFTTTGQRIR